jgi:hypothetical protein
MSHMKSPEEIVAYIALKIGYMYYHHRPILYGGTGAGVDLLLLNYHELWAEITNRQEELRETWHSVLNAEDCGSASFSMRYSMNNPEASQPEIAQYVVDQWRKISDQLELPLPHAELIAEFEKN